MESEERGVASPSRAASRSKFAILGCFVGLLMFLSLIGCTAPGGLLKFRDADLPKATAKQPVTSCLALWQPTTGEGLDGLTCRGFAGQIFFFAGEKQLPSVVNGEVRIFVFDDQGTPEEQVKPIHQFVFPAEMWKYYLNRTKMGATYALFIPYTRKGSHTAQCSLRVKYTPANGPTLHSEMVNVLLKGSSESKDKDQDQLAGRKAKRDDSAADPELRKVARDFDSSTRRHHDPAVQLAAAAIEQPETRRRSQPLTAAERQRILNEARARANGKTVVSSDDFDPSDDEDNEVVYVRPDKPSSRKRDRTETDRPADPRSSIETLTIELPHR